VSSGVADRPSSTFMADMCLIEERCSCRCGVVWFGGTVDRLCEMRVREWDGSTQPRPKDSRRSCVRGAMTLLSTPSNMNYAISTAPRVSIVTATQEDTAMCAAASVCTCSEHAVRARASTSNTCTASKRTSEGCVYCVRTHSQLTSTTHSCSRRFLWQELVYDVLLDKRVQWASVASSL
jgi:hypothetical protein